MTLRNIECSDDERINLITNRISEKIKDYEIYSFTDQQDCALKTFFDLAQEFEEQSDFLSICVLIPKMFFQFECDMFLSNSDGHYEGVCSSDMSTHGSMGKVFSVSEMLDTQALGDKCCRIPIRGNMQLLSSLSSLYRDGILGVFEIRSSSLLSEHMKFFLEKYVNRIGFQLHNRFITEKNREHLQFIKNLVNDIGHNVIVPNMYFKLFYRRLKGKIDRANAISNQMMEVAESSYDGPEGRDMKKLLIAEELNYVHESMETQFQEILSHYEQTSLFLETLLRRSHFEEGRYVIEPKMVNFREKIIRPQLERYIPRLEERGISVDNQLSGIPSEEITVVADVGLISQAYANLFSNAVKYTREVVDDGRTQKFVAVGMEFLEDYFGEGKDGVKFNVFSTGSHLPPEDLPKLFDEGYRGKNVESEYGTGHGLQFIKDVIDLHGGVVDYEATPSGNNFFFILPK